MKRKTIAVLCGMGFLGCMLLSCPKDDESKKLNKEGFNIELSDSYAQGDKIYHRVEVWGEKKSKNHRVENDIEYIYMYDGDDRNWLKAKMKYKRVSLGSYQGTSQELEVIEPSRLPGKPLKYDVNGNVRLVVDYDSGEEYAQGEFLTEQAALDWADEMVDIFNRKKDYVP